MKRDVSGRLRLSLVDGAALAVQDETLTLDAALGAIRLGPASPGLVAMAEALRQGEATLDELADRVLASAGMPGLTRFHVLVQQLSSLGVLQRTAVDGVQPLATIRPAGVGFQFTSRPTDDETPLILSRFALLRREGEEWRIESPLGHALIVMHDRRVSALVTALVQPQRPVELGEAAGGLNPDAVGVVLQLLLNAEVLTPMAAGQPSEENDPARMLWSFHDLLFHARSRFGRHVGPFGATFRHIDEIEPLPAIRPMPPGQTVDLPRPDLTAVAAADPPLTTIVEARRSIYADPAVSLTLDQLGEFLYRVARVRDRGDIEARASDGRVGAMQVSGRPYPTGGRTYEVEIYLSVDRCLGLTSGLYYYDPLGHRLALLRERDRLVEDLLRYATIAAPGSAPAIVIHLAARFGRVSWKYDAIAYATTLKHVGVLYQTMYLVATAMGLAPCALGSGNADLFAAAAGTDYLVESSVGDFMLGARPSVGAEDR